ncbi:MAG TPA: hypothetical protein VK302_15815 [Terriglobales bacterium]|nr:hypothetical protein [Terriglobales bacterium]
MLSPTSDAVTLWYHYEEIAMHFNSLIIQFRLQLIGGAGALGTFSAYLIGSKVTDEKERRYLRSLVASGLLTLIIVAALLDLFYYNRLLRGAVDALLDFERSHPDIQMSTKIEARVGWGINIVWVAYGLMVGLLFLFNAWSWCDFWRHRKGSLVPQK